MGSRIAYFHTVKLGTELLSIDPLHERQGRAIVPGIDQTRAKLERRSPNFLWTWRGWAQEYDPNPGSRSKEALHKDLLDEMVALEGLSDDGVLRSLVWIEDDAKTTTVSNSETAGSDVDVEIASLSALGAVANDYVLILGSNNSWVYLVKSTGSSPDKLVLDLTEDLAGGEAVYLVTIHYPDCRYEGQDPGRAPEHAGDRVKFRKSYTFVGESLPVYWT